MPNEVSKAVFLKALKLLDAKLGDAQERVTFLCVGGGALMLSLGMRESTEDLDGVLQPSDPDTTLLFNRLAAQVGQELGIGDIWINTQVKSIMVGQRFAPSYFEERAQYVGKNLKVLFAKPGYLLMMKSQSLRRGSKDFSDIVRLVKLLDIRSLDTLRQVIEKFGGNWDFIGNNEYELLRLCVAWAFPNATPYDAVRLKYLEMTKKQ